MGNEEVVQAYVKIDRLKVILNSLRVALGPVLVSLPTTNSSSPVPEQAQAPLNNELDQLVAMGEMLLKDIKI